MGHEWDPDELRMQAERRRQEALDAAEATQLAKEEAARKADEQRRIDSDK